jgi:hypothetical protein
MSKLDRFHWESTKRSRMSLITTKDWLAEEYRRAAALIDATSRPSRTCSP